MAFDAAQILRQTYAAGADAARMSDFAQPRTEAAPVARGELMGMSVVAEADPMAEMQGPRTALLKAIETWMKMMPDMPNQEFMARLARNLRGMAASGQTPDPHELLKELGRGSTDPSHQFAMLDILEQAFGAGEEELRALVRETKARLAEAKGPEIRAGINLAEEVNARATTPEQMQELRDMYRSEVVGFTKPQDCFRSLLAARGPGGLADAIQFLIAGCGKDLASASPSLESAALGRILTDLNCVQVLQTVLDSFTQLAARMGKQFGETCLLNGEQLTGRVVDFTEQAFIAANAIAAFVGDCGLVKLMAQMDFTRELTRLFRLLSPRLFAKEGDRQRLVDAAQEHLDLLVERENEEEEGEGAA